MFSKGVLDMCYLENLNTHFSNIHSNIGGLGLPTTVGVCFVENIKGADKEPDPNNV